MKEIITTGLNILGCIIIWMIFEKLNPKLGYFNKEWFKYYIIITIALVLVRMR